MQKNKYWTIEASGINGTMYYAFRDRGKLFFSRRSSKKSRAVRFDTKKQASAELNKVKKSGIKRLFGSILKCKAPKPVKYLIAA